MTTTSKKEDRLNAKKKWQRSIFFGMYAGLSTMYLARRALGLMVRSTSLSSDVCLVWSLFFDTQKTLSHLISSYTFLVHRTSHLISPVSLLLNFKVPEIMRDIGMSKSQWGSLGTAFAITYGISKFTAGLLTDTVVSIRIFARDLYTTISLRCFLLTCLSTHLSIHLHWQSSRYLLSLAVACTGVANIIFSMSERYSYVHLFYLF